MIVHSGYGRPYFVPVGAQQKKQMRDEFRKSFAVNRIGGRDRDRTGDPLLAKTRKKIYRLSSRMIRATLLWFTCIPRRCSSAVIRR